MMDLIKAIIHIVIICGIVFLVVRKAENGLRIHGYLSFLLKGLAGFALGYYYFKVELSGDTIGFYKEALQFADWGRNDPHAYFAYLFGSGRLPFESQFLTSPRAEWFSKWISTIYLTGPSYYWVSSLYLSLIAWVGLWKLSVTLIKWNYAWKPAIFFSLMYYPSVVFWSSGLIKESLAIGILAYLSSVFISLQGEKFSFGKIVKWLVTLLLFVVLWKVKYYYAAVFILSLFVTLILYWKSLKVAYYLRIALVIFSVSVIWYGSGQINPNLGPGYLPEVIAHHYQIFADKSVSGRYVEFSTICPDWICIGTTFPFAVLAGLFLPLPFEAWNLFSFLSGLENCILILLTITFLVNSIRYGFPLKRNGFLFMIVLYCLLLSGFIAMSAPNFGTLTRYRSGYLPFFLLLITVNNSYFCGWVKLIKSKTSKYLK